VSEATFYIWKKKDGNLGVSELRQLRQLRDENVRLKRLVAGRSDAGSQNRTNLTALPKPHELCPDQLVHIIAEAQRRRKEHL